MGGMGIMGIITGFLCLFCFAALTAKALTRKLNLYNIDLFFMKLHKPASGLLLAGCIAHVLSVWTVLKMRNVLVIVTGLFIFIAYILLIIFCHRKGQTAGYRLRWHRILTAVMLFFITAHITFYSLDYLDYRHKVASIRLTGIDCSGIADGNYTGEYDAGYIYARVEVSVANGAITGIRILEHRHERGTAAEQIVHHITATGRTDTDAVSGATNSSLVIQKAVENALN